MDGRGRGKRNHFNNKNGNQRFQNWKRRKADRQQFTNRQWLWEGRPSFRRYPTKLMRFSNDAIGSADEARELEEKRRTASLVINKLQTLTAEDKSKSMRQLLVDIPAASSTLDPSVINVEKEKETKRIAHVKKTPKPNVPAPKSSKRISHPPNHLRRSGEERIKREVFKGLLTVSVSNLKSIITSPSLEDSKVLSQLMKATRLSISETMRKLAELKLKNKLQAGTPQLLTELENLVDADVAVDVCNMPVETIQALQDIFNLDIESNLMSFATKDKQADFAPSFLKLEVDEGDPYGMDYSTDDDDEILPKSIENETFVLEKGTKSDVCNNMVITSDIDFNNVKGINNGAQNTVGFPLLTAEVSVPAVDAANNHPTLNFSSENIRKAEHVAQEHMKLREVRFRDNKSNSKANNKAVSTIKPSLSVSLEKSPKHSAMRSGDSNLLLKDVTEENVRSKSTVVTSLFETSSRNHAADTLEQLSHASFNMPFVVLERIPDIPAPSENQLKSCSEIRIFPSSDAVSDRNIASINGMLHGNRGTPETPLHGLSAASMLKNLANQVSGKPLAPASSKFGGNAKLSDSLLSKESRDFYKELPPATVDKKMKPSAQNCNKKINHQASEGTGGKTLIHKGSKTNMPSTKKKTKADDNLSPFCSKKGVKGCGKNLSNSSESPRDRMQPNTNRFSPQKPQKRGSSEVDVGQTVRKKSKKNKNRSKNSLWNDSTNSITPPTMNSQDTPRKKLPVLCRAIQTEYLTKESFSQTEQTFSMPDDASVQVANSKSELNSLKAYDPILIKNGQSFSQKEDMQATSSFYSEDQVAKEFAGFLEDITKLSYSCPLRRKIAEQMISVMSLTFQSYRSLFKT